MQYTKTKIDFISNGEIKTKADKFRLKVWGQEIPVDIEKIIEIKLKIDIIPIPGMLNQCGMDAQITKEYSHLETQANKFASYFLLPREELAKVKLEIIRKMAKGHDISKFDEKTINSYLAEYVAPKFLVSSGSAEIALNDLNNFS